MSSVTREEIDAKLETIEVKMDGRIASIEGKFELLFHRMDRMGQDVSNFKWWLAGAVLTIVVGISTFNGALLNNMVASFESGKNTATLITQNIEQMKQTMEQMKAIEARMAAPPVAAPASHAKAGTR